MHRLPPAVKILLTVAFVLCVVATPRHWFWAFGVAFALLPVVWLVAAVPFGWFARRALIETPFMVLALVLPFTGGAPRFTPLGLSIEGTLAGWNILVKGTLGVLASLTLSATTHPQELLDGLARLRVPRIFVTIAGLMLRYAEVIVGEARRMRIARISRGHDPRFLWQAGATARGIGMLFLRSYERGERVHLAMVSRGWSTDSVSPGEVASPAVSVRGLTFSYPDGHRALAGIDLEIQPGERVAVLGPNGAGKTTLVLHLNGVLSGGSGSVAIGGLPVVKAQLPEIRRRVGIVFQDPDDQLFMPTVGEDVAFGPRNFGVVEPELTARVAEALAAVAMSDAADRSPIHLSQGQRRRVALAGVLACRPEVLVLDEPSANLEPLARRELAEVLSTVEQTVVMVTHDLPYARQLCPRAVIVDEGRVVADGPTAVLLADAELLAAHRLELPWGFHL